MGPAAGMGGRRKPRPGRKGRNLHSDAAFATYPILWRRNPQMTSTFGPRPNGHSEAARDQRRGRRARRRPRCRGGASTMPLVSSCPTRKALESRAHCGGNRSDRFDTPSGAPAGRTDGYGFCVGTAGGGGGGGMSSGGGGGGCRSPWACGGGGGGPSGRGCEAQAASEKQAAAMNAERRTMRMATPWVVGAHRPYRRRRARQVSVLCRRVSGRKAS